MDVNNSYFLCQEYSYFFDTFTIQNAFTMHTPAYCVRLRADLPNQIETHSNNRLIFHLEEFGKLLWHQHIHRIIRIEIRFSASSIS